MDVYSFTCLFCLQFSFINHSFLLNTATKSLAMYYDSRIRMINERRTAIVNSLIHGSPHAPYLRLRVRRDHLIDDALVEVCDMQILVMELSLPCLVICNVQTTPMVVLMFAMYCATCSLFMSLEICCNEICSNVCLQLNKPFYLKA